MFEQNLDTSSNSLFGVLAVTEASQTRSDPVLMAETNSSAGRCLGLRSLGLLVVFKALVHRRSTPILDWMLP